LRWLAEKSPETFFRYDKTDLVRYTLVLGVANLKAEIGEWKVDLFVDVDGHLSVYVSNNDGTEVQSCNADIGGDNEWAERFTTQQIEASNNESELKTDAA
jgi:hypothetical protein